MPPDSTDVVWPRRRASIVEDHQVELAKALGVGDQVDLDHLPVTDDEAEDDPRPSARSPHRSQLSQCDKEIHFEGEAPPGGLPS
jgi:hypothetical protein